MEIPSIIELDFNVEVTNMNGDKIGMLKDSISFVLEKAKIIGINSQKATDWAELLYNSKPLQMDKSDYKALKKWCISEENQYFAPIMTRRINEFFDKKDKELNLD